MTYIQFFPYAVAALDICACAIYTYNRDWRLAIVWLGVGVSNAAFAGVK